MYAKQTHLVLDLLTIRHLTAVLADLDVLLTEVGVLGPRGLEEGRVGVHDQVNVLRAFGPQYHNLVLPQTGVSIRRVRISNKIFVLKHQGYTYRG